jgi:hypothetical protein
MDGMIIKVEITSENTNGIKKVIVSLSAQKGTCHTSSDLS